MAGSNIFVGTLDLLIMQALRHQGRHGYDIGRWIRERTDGVLDVAEGALYPALHRMERKGWLEADWGQSDKGRQVKLYRLTKTGQSQLETDSSRWHEHAEAVAAVLQS